MAIEQAVADAFLAAITPAAVEAVRLSVEQLASNHDAALAQWHLAVERAHYEAERAERRYRIVEPLCVFAKNVVEDNQAPLESVAFCDEDHITWRQATVVTCVLESQWVKQLRISKEEHGGGKGRNWPSRIHPEFNAISLGERRRVR
jgi:hypothetical protein